MQHTFPSAWVNTPTRFDTIVRLDSTVSRRKVIRCPR